LENSRDTLFRKVELCVSSICSSPLILGGTRASKTNVEIFGRCLGAWLVLLEDLMLRLGLSEVSRDSRRRNFVESLASADLAEVLNFLDAVYMRLITSNDTIDTFKQYLSSQAPQGLCYERLLSPCNKALYPFLTETDKKTKAYLLSISNQFLRFARKLEFQDIGLETKALTNYMETEQELEAMKDNYDELVIVNLSKIIHKWFKDFHIDELLPCHGSGSVAEGPLTLADKFGVLTVDPLIKEVLRSINGPKDSFLEYFPIQPGNDLVRCSRTIFVPKTATKLRTISMEPCVLQYLQQGVMKALYEYIDRHPYLGVRIRLGDQTQNQYLALEGSMYHNYGTIDLSHASDSVSWDLIRRVFSRTPSLFKWMLATRSRMTMLPDGTTLQLNKFAPMGSALCFPIECILFAAIIEYATNKYCKLMHTSPKLYSIYGDDLVVDSAIYDEVINILTICGFTVNYTKSYNDGEYRESCGEEYYAGLRVTALYYRTPFYNKRVSPSAFGSWCSAANNAALHRLPLYRVWLLHHILRASYRFKPYFTPNQGKSPFLWSSQATNHLIRPAWNKNLQRWEGRFVTVKSRQRQKDEAHEDLIKYFMKLIEMKRRPIRPESHLDESSFPNALHGSVEHFCSTILPVSDWCQHDLLLAQDW